MSDASIATSVPVPIAIPRSAWASAGASLTPSPTIATTRPFGLQARDDGGLLGGQHLGDHVVGPDPRGDGAGPSRVLSPVSRIVCKPSSRSRAHGLARTSA